MMCKRFEEYFSELQADMVAICLEYVGKKADKIYIYCSIENMVIFCDFFYSVNGCVVRKHKLNDVVSEGNVQYDTSEVRQRAVLDILVNDMEYIYKLCQRYQKEVPTEIKLVYDVANNRLNADYQYNIIYANDTEKTAYDVAMEWFEESKVKEVK